MTPRGPIATPAPPLTRAHSLSRRFGDLAAVADVSMEVAPGEVVGLLGANGAGKTTLMRMLLGLLVPSEGTVTLLGGLPDRRARSRLGYVPQGLGLYSDLTVSENLSFVAGSYGVPVRELPPALAPLADRLVGEIPLGLQRRLAFTCALVHGPALLMLDEPTSGVDPIARAELWDTIRAQAESGVGVLVTTHNMAEAQQCDRLLLMSDGRLVAEGSEADVIGGTTAIRISTPDWAAAFAALEAQGQPVTLSGRSVRVADGDPDVLRRILAAAAIEADLVEAPATIEERMTVLARSARGS